MGERASLASLTSTQREILTALKLDHELGTEELAQQVYVTPGAVRHHLALLVNASYVTYRTEGEGRGRPRFIYSLTPDGETLFPTTFEDLAVHLLAALRKAPEAPLEQLLCETTSGRLGRPEIPPGASGEACMAGLRQLFEKHGYMPSEKDSANSLTLNHCPVRAAAEVEPGICAAEQAHVECVLGRRVELASWRLRGDRVCQFRVVS